VAAVAFDADETAAPPAVAGGLAPRAFGWLPLAADFETRLRIEATGQNADVASYRLLRRMLTPNFGLPLHVPLVDGYENLMTREQALLVAALGSERATGGDESDLNRIGIAARREAFAERWSAFIAAGGGALVTVEAQQPLAWPVSVRYQPRAVPAAEDLPWLNLYRVTYPLPRAFLATTWVAVEDAPAALRRLLAPLPPGGHPPVVIATGGPAARSATAARPALPDDAGFYDARITRYEPQLVEVAIEADADAMLVLLDAGTPGWTATVSGTVVPILQANVAFRAVPVPAGRHRVVFTYTPPHWPLALATTAAATLALLGWLAAALAMRRRAP
jgi:hypothetical protein